MAHLVWISWFYDDGWWQTELPTLYAFMCDVGPHDTLCQIIMAHHISLAVYEHRARFNWRQGGTTTSPPPHRPHDCSTCHINRLQRVIRCRNTCFIELGICVIVDGELICYDWSKHNGECDTLVVEVAHVFQCAIRTVAWSCVSFNWFCY